MSMVISAASGAASASGPCRRHSYRNCQKQAKDEKQPHARLPKKSKNFKISVTNLYIVVYRVLSVSKVLLK